MSSTRAIAQKRSDFLTPTKAKDLVVSKSLSIEMLNQLAVLTALFIFVNPMAGIVYLVLLLNAKKLPVLAWFLISASLMLYLLYCSGTAQLGK